jgi:hypothetical protein
MPEVTVGASFQFMQSPRWHDALIVAAIVALLAVGVWALWWDDVRRTLHFGPDEGSSVEPPASANPQT